MGKTQCAISLAFSIYNPYAVYSKPCGIIYKYTKEGKKVRVSNRTGQPIPKPLETMQRRDIKYRSGYIGKKYLRGLTFKEFLHEILISLNHSDLD